MFNNVLKIVVRNLWRYKGYTLINIIGLGIGIAAIVWGYQAYEFAFSFDDFQPDRDHVYRAVTKKDGADSFQGIVPMPLVQAAKNDLAGIAEVVRFDDESMNVKAGTNDAFSERVHFTDPSFFSLFNFPVLKGKADLSDKSAVLITAATAKKYFGEENPIGKTLLLYAGQPFAKPLMVTGVLKDVPPNSTIKFDLLTNFENLLKPDGTIITAGDWKWFIAAAFFKVPNAADAKALPEKLQKYLPIQNKAREDWKATGFKFLSLRESALLVNEIDSNGLYERTEDAAAYGPLVLSILLLLSACLNFSNTTVAKANQKLKEIGMRKVMGGTQRQLILQLLLECGFIVLLAIFLSVVSNNWWLPAYNKMFGFIELHTDYFHDGKLQLFLVSTLVGATLLAGSYPAFYITRFNPSNIFRGSVKFGGSNLFSRIMLGLQVSVAIITTVAGVAFARNATFAKEFDFGYNTKNTMAVFVKDKSSYQALRNDLSAMPQITAMAGTRGHVGYNFWSRVAAVQGIKKEVRYLEVGNGYTDLMGFKMVAGRGFEKGMESDYANTILVTQKFAALYGWNDAEALNKQVKLDSATYNIAGVVKDFHSNELFDELRPVIIKLAKEDAYQYLVIQAKQGDLTKVFEQSRGSWKKLFPMQPFTGFYQDEMAAQGYRVSNSIATIFSWVAVISVLLAATGLFALVSLTVLKRTKEIAIRKVSGARAEHILVLIGKSYCLIFIFSALIGCYAGWMLTKLMLNLIYKVHAGIENYTLPAAAIALFVIVACTISIRVWQSVKANPVKMLRAE